MTDTLQYTTLREQSGHPCPAISRTVSLDEALAMLFEISLSWGGRMVGSRSGAFTIMSQVLNCVDTCEYTGTNAWLMEKICRQYQTLQKRDVAAAKREGVERSLYDEALKLRTGKLLYVTCLGNHVYSGDTAQIMRVTGLVEEHKLDLRQVTAAFVLGTEGFDFVEALEIAVMRPNYKYDDIRPAAA